jgi:virulence-associated protein VapD
MFAIAFDLVVADAAEHHPRGVTAAYTEIGASLKKFGFERIQGSVYVSENNDMANLFAALLALKALPWFPKVVRDIRGFRIENWSDFTPIVKGPPVPP